jgi:hypothetical protein
MQNLVRRVQDPTEEIQLLAQNLERQPVRLVVASNEIDYGNIALLAVPMAAPDTLFDALRIPWKIVIDDSVAKLQVQALGAGLGANEHLRTRAKLVHQGKAHSNFTTWSHVRWKPRGFFLFPPRERLLRTFVIVHAAEKGDVVVLKANIQKQTPQVFLRRN